MVPAVQNGLERFDDSVLLAWNVISMKLIDGQSASR
jgi:hypothetical protein